MLVNLDASDLVLLIDILTLQLLRLTIPVGSMDHLHWVSLVPFALKAVAIIQVRSVTSGQLDRGQGVIFETHPLQVLQRVLDERPWLPVVIDSGRV